MCTGCDKKNYIDETFISIKNCIHTPEISKSVKIETHL